MKRVIERITFIFVGFLIATVSYIVGNHQQNVDAQDVHLGVTMFEEIQCRKLRIMDPIHKSGYMLFDFNEDNGPVLTLVNMSAKGGLASLSASNNTADLTLTTKDRLSEKSGGLFFIVNYEGSGISIEGKESFEYRK